MNFVRANPNLGRPYKITEELIDLSTMAMEYFKDHIEPTLPQFGFFSKDFCGGSSQSKCKSEGEPSRFERLIILLSSRSNVEREEQLRV